MEIGGVENERIRIVMARSVKRYVDKVIGGDEHQHSRAWLARLRSPYPSGLLGAGSDLRAEVGERTGQGLGF